jgi:hypothetical protein
VRLLYAHGWQRQRVIDLFAVLDWLMRLPDVLEQEPISRQRPVEAGFGPTPRKTITMPA